MMTLEFIKKYVEDGTGLSDIQQKSRQREYVSARALYSILAREFTGFSLNSIGEKIGRDHSTIVHLYKVGPSLVEWYPHMKNLYLKFKTAYRHMMYQDFSKGIGRDETVEKLTKELNELKHRTFESELRKEAAEGFAQEVVELVEGLSDEKLERVMAKLKASVLIEKKAKEYVARQ